jgi:hypothetical protein
MESSRGTGILWMGVLDGSMSDAAGILLSLYLFILMLLSAATTMTTSHGRVEPPAVVCQSTVQEDEVRPANSRPVEQPKACRLYHRTLFPLQRIHCFPSLGLPKDDAVNSANADDSESSS